MENKNVKHTPGPWTYHVESHSVIKSDRKPGYSDYVAVLPETQNEAADGLLLSAAPELLAALEQGEEIIRGLEAEADNAGIDLAEVRAWWQKAAAVLAKAKGEKI